MKGSVLIADERGDHGDRIATACAERGLQCRVVPHGAAALETALASLPDVLVAQRDLPLIQGIVLTFALMFALVTLIVDLLYARIDPRIRLE